MNVSDTVVPARSAATCLPGMKKTVLVTVALIAGCAVLIGAIGFYIGKRERERYDETVEILKALTMEPESNFINVHHDAWGRTMHVDRDADCWSVVSTGHDPADASDDVVMKWNPRLGQINIGFEYDGQIRSCSMNEERDN